MLWRKKSVYVFHEMNMFWPTINPKIKVKAELPKDETVNKQKATQ